MKLLRDRWRRTAIHQFFVELPQIDRVTFWVAVALAFAAAIAISQIARAPAAADIFTAPPFELRFA
jgi:hypothetical protein